MEFTELYIRMLYSLFTANKVTNLALPYELLPYPIISD